MSETYPPVERLLLDLAHHGHHLPSSGFRLLAGLAIAVGGRPKKPRAGVPIAAAKLAALIGRDERTVRDATYALERVGADPRVPGRIGNRAYKGKPARATQYRWPALNPPPGCQCPLCPVSVPGDLVPGKSVESYRGKPPHYVGGEVHPPTPSGSPPPAAQSASPGAPLVPPPGSDGGRKVKSQQGSWEKVKITEFVVNQDVTEYYVQSQAEVMPDAKRTGETGAYLSKHLGLSLVDTDEGYLVLGGRTTEQAIMRKLKEFESLSD